MTFLSEGSETMARVQEPVLKKCIWKFFCVSYRRILGYLKLCCSYFRPTYRIVLILSCSSKYKSSKGAYESYGKSRFFDTKRSCRRTNSSSSIKPSLWLIRSRFRTFLKAMARATSRRTKSRRLLKTIHCLTFLFPTKNETLDPILLGLRTSSSCISLSMLKVPKGEAMTTPNTK